VRIVGNLVGAAVFGAILNFRINRGIPEAGDAVRPESTLLQLCPLRMALAVIGSRILSTKSMGGRSAISRNGAGPKTRKSAMVEGLRPSG
jgi:hypothetical protein